MNPDELDQEIHSLLADIVGHPVGQPTLEELKYMSPGVDAATIRKQLFDLEERGVIESVKGPIHTFYGLTPEAHSAFAQTGILPEAAWRRQYAAVQKTKEILELEDIPRPDTDS